MWPVVSWAEEVDLTLRRIVVERVGRDALIAKDGATIELRAAFDIRINAEPSDILEVARAIGCRDAGDASRIRERFEPRFLDALERVGGRTEAERLLQGRFAFKDEVINEVGVDLDGFRLDDVAIERIAIGSPRGAA